MFQWLCIPVAWLATLSGPVQPTPAETLSQLAMSAPLTLAAKAEVRHTHHRPAANPITGCRLHDEVNGRIAVSAWSTAPSSGAQTLDVDRADSDGNTVHIHQNQNANFTADPSLLPGRIAIRSSGSPVTETATLTQNGKEIPCTD